MPQKLPVLFWDYKATAVSFARRPSGASRPKTVAELAALLPSVLERALRGEL
ncbi:MAG: hypothetical protein NTV25_03130 [Methanothrix sp.]|nr:hypothetical protein [Methanothrix sp.]